MTLKRILKNIKNVLFDKKLLLFFETNHTSQVCDRLPVEAAYGGIGESLMPLCG